MRSEQLRQKRARRASVWQRWALNIGAILGTLCLLMTLCTVVFGLKPLIFASGSMGPEIPTGALGIAIPTATSEIQPGEIVSVVNSEGTRITHRVVENEPSGLILKGDANEVADFQPYVVDSVDRLLFAVPILGYVISWFSQPWAFFVGGLICAYLLYLAFGKRDSIFSDSDSDSSKRSLDATSQKSTGNRSESETRKKSWNLIKNPLIAASIVTLSALPAVSTVDLTTQAAFTATAQAEASVASAVLPSVQGTMKCEPSGVLGTRAKVSWTGVQLPPGARYATRLETSPGIYTYSDVPTGTTTFTYQGGLNLLGLITEGANQTMPVKVLVVFTSSGTDGRNVLPDGSNIVWQSPAADAPTTSVVYHPGLLLVRYFTCK